jgi:predicted SAM-dependent methyltransferase
MEESVKPDIVLDVIEGLPFKDNSISCIHSEDFIEHISLDDGKFFLRECFRVLKQDGFLRIVTPDLHSFVLGYMNRDPRALQWYKETFGCRTFAEMLNTGMRMAGHTFLYDRETLRIILEEAGFSVKETEYLKSDVEEFENIDVRGDGVHIYFHCQRKDVK